MKIARLPGECEVLKRAAKAEEDMAVETEESAPVEETNVGAEEVEESSKLTTSSTIAILDGGDVRITVTADKATLSISKGLYLQPENERSRWWRLRGYDTDLPDAKKDYYIYVRLSLKGFDGEVRFLTKPRLALNDTHRFVQVGVISPVVDGRRTLTFDLAGFRSKHVGKGTSLSART